MKDEVKAARLSSLTKRLPSAVASMKDEVTADVNRSSLHPSAFIFAKAEAARLERAGALARPAA